MIHSRHTRAARTEGCTEVLVFFRPEEGTYEDVHEHLDRIKIKL